MKKQVFHILINAPSEKVWKILWDDAGYRAWTAAFTEGSRAETDWEKGSKVLFLDAKGSGMVSMIKEKMPNKFMSFAHLGIVKNGVEDLESAEAKVWAGGIENYTLTDMDGNTELTVELSSEGIPQDMMDYCAAIWPTALNKLKELAEEK